MKEVENLGWQGWAKADLCLIQDFFTMAWSVSYVKGSIQRFIPLLFSVGKLLNEFWHSVCKMGIVLEAAHV